MAKRKLVAQLNLVNCKVVDSLELVTKPNLAMTHYGKEKTCCSIESC
nr:MAG TPA: hypothetical protein [Microviridae sp.]